MISPLDKVAKPIAKSVCTVIKYFNFPILRFQEDKIEEYHPKERGATLF